MLKLLFSSRVLLVIGILIINTHNFFQSITLRLLYNISFRNGNLLRLDFNKLFASTLLLRIQGVFIAVQFILLYQLFLLMIKSSLSHLFLFILKHLIDSFNLALFIPQILFQLHRLMLKFPVLVDIKAGEDISYVCS